MIDIGVVQGEVDMGSLEKRLNLLKKLKIAIKIHEDEIYDALKKDLDKDYGESTTDRKSVV